MVHTEGDGSMQQVTKGTVHGGASIFASFKYRWWELQLVCGHSVERRMHYLPGPEGNPARGFAAQWHGVPTGRIPPVPKRARCREERR